VNDEATEDQSELEMQDILLTDGDDTQEQQAPAAPDRTDWKAEAIRAQERLRAIEERQQQAQPAQPEPKPDPIAELEAEIARIEAEIPQNPKTEQDFWKMVDSQGKLTKLTRQLTAETRKESQQYAANMQSQSVADRFKAQHSGDPVFQQIAPLWEQWVQQLDPSLRSNTGMLEMLRKNLAYDYMQKNGGRVPNQPKKGGPPAPSAPSGAFTPEQQRQQAQQKAGVKFKSDREAQVAAFYGMTAEEYYSSAYNDVGPDTEGNGIQIMDMPATSRRSRRG